MSREMKWINSAKMNDVNLKGFVFYAHLFFCFFKHFPQAFQILSKISKDMNVSRHFENISAGF